MSLPSGLQAAVAARNERFLTELEALVNVDCGSYTPDGVNLVADAVAASLTRLGATIERIAHRPQRAEPRLGDLVIGRLAGVGPRLLLIGHMDTVFEPGTAAARPFQRAGSLPLQPARKKARKPSLPSRSSWRNKPISSS